MEPLPASAAAPGILALVLQADLVVQLVLLLLVGMSVACWVIIFGRLATLRRAIRESTAFLDVFWNSRRLDQVYERCDEFPQAPVAQVFRSGYVELHRLTGGEIGPEAATDNVARALRRAANAELTELERSIPFLATTGSTAPFIGLFGTVWGILRAFQRIGVTGQATIQTVGPDIAHALIATAVGLAAAIPAVIAYNHFTGRLRLLHREMDNFSADFLNIVKRHFRG